MESDITLASWLQRLEVLSLPHPTEVDAKCEGNLNTKN